MASPHIARSLALLCLPLPLLAACGDKTHDDTGTPSSSEEEGGEEEGDEEEEGGTDDTGMTPTDLDGDGYDSIEDGGEDCDDTNEDVFPGADETCNEVDDDCDGDVDEEPIDGTTHYADADGDGFGDPDTAELSCSVPEGRVLDATDCGDDSAWVYPGAPEICDGRQTDCDATDWTSDAGTAHWLGEDETTWVDMAATLGGAGSEAVTEVSLDEPGTLHICEGTWPVAITANADVDIVGGDGTDAVVLDGLESATVLTVGAEGITVTATDLTLADGLGTQVHPGQRHTVYIGGNVSCAVDATVRLQSVKLVRGYARYGMALGLYQCDAEVSDLRLEPATEELRDSIIDVTEGSLSITDTVLSDLTLHDPLLTAGGDTTVEVSGLKVERLTMARSIAPIELEEFEDVPVSATFTDLVVTDSTFDDYPLILLSQQGVVATIDGAEFSGNTGNEGTVAMLDNDNTTLSITDLHVSDSTADYTPGIMVWYGTLELSDSSFEDLWSDDGGGAIYTEGQVSIDNVTFTDTGGTDAERSGAIHFLAGELTATNVSFTDSDPTDVYHDPTGTQYDFGTADFSCDSEGCE